MRRLNRMPATVVLALMLAQSVPADAGDAAKLERIRRMLAEPAAIVAPSPSPREGPVFRLTVFGRKPDTKPIWWDSSGVPSYVRPQFPSYHFEFLERVSTEEVFRAGNLYPSQLGVPVVPMIELLAKGIKAVNRKRKEAGARDEVKKALEEFLACRADPTKPGCRP